MSSTAVSPSPPTREQSSTNGGWQTVAQWLRTWCGKYSKFDGTQGRVTLLVSVVLPMLIVAGLHGVVVQPSEPVFYGDENRHVMTGVFFADMLSDMPVGNPKTYAEQYYLQYPALGLLVWPPLFHLVEGLLMTVCGTSFWVGRLAVAGFAVLAGVYFFRLMARTHDRLSASVALVWFGLCPLVFMFSRQVMLEIPTLAWSLMAVFHFERYLESTRRRDLVLIALAAAAAALTRFDAIWLLPCFGFLLVARRKLHLLRSWEVWIAIVGAVLLVLPFYALAAREVGALHSRQATHSVMAEPAGFLAAKNFGFYLRMLPHQIGWLLVGLAVIGFSRQRRWEWLQQNIPYLAMALATYATFTPIAELDLRHSIYWIPAFVVMAWNGVNELARGRFRPYLRPAIAALVAGVMTSAALTAPRPTLAGYREAAEWVLKNSPNESRFLFDGWLDGNFSYHIRNLDPARQHAVLRGDKLLYGFICVPSTDLHEYAQTERDIMDVIYRYDPEFVVVEDPQPKQVVPTAVRLRQVLREHPDCYRLEHTVAVTGVSDRISGYSLLIYRNLNRNPAPESRVKFEVLGLNRTVGED